MRFAVFACFLAIAGNAGAAGRDATAKEIEVIRAGMESRLLDSESARFRSVKIGRDVDPSSTLELACGQVNAKNAYGAYTGFNQFVSVYIPSAGGNKKPYSLALDVSDEAGFASQKCRDAGLL